MGGSVPDSSQLPPNADEGHVLIAADTGQAFQFHNGAWHAIGQWRGPQGVPGPTGPQGEPGSSGASTAQDVTVTTVDSQPWQNVQDAIQGLFDRQIPIVSPVAPSDPSPNALWWDSSEGTMWLWFDDGNTQQWVEVTGGGGGDSGGPQKGVTDGSNAAPGEVGEFLQAVISTYVQLPTGTNTLVGSLVLPPGDWDARAAWRVGAGGMGSAIIYGQLGQAYSMADFDQRITFDTNFYQASGNISPWRFSSASPQTVSLYIMTTWSNITSLRTEFAWISARRVR
jgi:hypothetical protein